MQLNWRPPKKGHFEEWPPQHRMIIGGIKALLFLEGVFILLPYGAIHIAALIILWIFSYPVIFYGMCRKCLNYGRKCPVPGEGDLVGRFFERCDDPPGVSGWFMVGLCYLMRLIYPAVFLFRYDYHWFYSMIYILTILFFFTALGRLVACPNCRNERCFLNPDYK